MVSGINYWQNVFYRIHDDVSGDRRKCRKCRLKFTQPVKESCSTYTNTTRYRILLLGILIIAVFENNVDTLPVKATSANGCFVNFSRTVVILSNLEVVEVTR